MPRMITENCVSCGACTSYCPVEAISQGETQYVIDASICIDCSECQGNCPTGSIERI